MLGYPLPLLAEIRAGLHYFWGLVWLNRCRIEVVEYCRMLPRWSTEVAYHHLHTLPQLNYGMRKRIVQRTVLRKL